MRQLFFLFLFGAALQTAWAQTPQRAAPQPSTPATRPVLPLSLEEAVALAVRQNPSLSAAVRDIASSEAGLRSSRSLQNPSVVFVPAITDRVGSGEEFLLHQPLELNGTRTARAGVARAELRVTQAQALVELREIVAGTKRSYYRLLQARELRQLSEASLEAIRDFDRRTRRLVELGKRPGVERTQTGIEVVRAEQQLVQARAQELSTLSALNTLLGRPSGELLSPTSTLDFVPIVVDEKVALSLALSSRAEITAAAATRESFEQRARLARAEGTPDLAPQIRAESLTRPPRNIGIGLAITLPFFDYGSRRNRVRQAENQAEAQQFRITATRAQVEQEVTQAFSALQAAETVIQGYRQGVLDQSKRLLDASRTGFELGQSNILTVLEAQRTYRAVQSEYFQALTSYNEARAELERVTGTFVLKNESSKEETKGDKD